MNDIPGRSIDDPVPLWNKVCGLYSSGMRDVAPIFFEYDLVISFNIKRAGSYTFLGSKR